MREQGTLFVGVSLGASVNSVGMQLDNVTRISFQSVITGSPAGSLKLQCSNDLTNDPSAVVNWQDYVSSSQAVSGAGLNMLELTAVNVKWVRLAYDFNAGTGNITTNFYSILDGKE